MNNDYDKMTADELSMLGHNKQRIATELRESNQYADGQAYYQCQDRIRQLESEAGQILNLARQKMAENILTEVAA